MTTVLITRRTLLGAMAMPILGGCSTPLPVSEPPVSDANADARLRDSAEAHGAAAFKNVSDVNVSYTGEWRPQVNRIQPEVVDAGYRGSSQERLMPSAGIVAQAYSGDRGSKHVVWHRAAGDASNFGDANVWLDGVPSTEADRRQAAALVAEGYGLFLLGPLWLSHRTVRARMNGTATVNGRVCDVIDVWLSPGLGRTARDRVAVYIDRADSLTRRMRFTLEGFVNTQGAVAEVDTFDHERRFGITWPMRSFERIVHPVKLPAHDWRITGLDVNRGYGTDDILGPGFKGTAMAPAKAVR